MERKGSEHLNVDSKIFKSPMSKEDNSLENSKNMSSSNSSDTPSHLRKKGSKNKKHKTPCKGIKCVYDKSNSGFRTDKSNSGFRTDKSNSGFRTDKSNSGFRTDKSNSGFRTDKSNSGFRTDKSNSGFRTDKSNSGFRTDKSNSGFRTDNSNSGFRTDKSNSGFRTDKSNSGFRTDKSNSGFQDDVPDAPIHPPRRNNQAAQIGNQSNVPRNEQANVDKQNQNWEKLALQIDGAVRSISQIEQSDQTIRSISQINQSDQSLRSISQIESRTVNHISECLLLIHPLQRAEYAIRHRDLACTTSDLLTRHGPVPECPGSCCRSFALTSTDNHDISIDASTINTRF
ncbi:hypothetical protein GJ496_002016 [Pomphorhynchus laevis]|nr:hypothetical protein GJ496_002016 [Pomphorhynchus laevis]